MSYKLEEQYSSTFYGGPMVPKGITIHWWGDPAQRPTYEGTINVLLERGRQESASVHFVCEAGRVACLVSPTVNSWGNGDGGAGWGNLNTITIENNPRCTAEDRETLAELIAWLRRTYTDYPLPLFPHNKWTATQCPGVWEQWLPWLDKRANEINANGGSTPVAVKPAPVAPKPAPAPIVKGNGKVPYCTVEAGDTGYGIASQFGVPFDKINAYNPGVNWNALKIGQRIYLVNWCRVEAGDTGYGIASQMGISFAQLSAYNPGVNWNALKVGQELWLE